MFGFWKQNSPDNTWDRLSFTDQKFDWIFYYRLIFDTVFFFFSSNRAFAFCARYFTLLVAFTAVRNLCCFVIRSNVLDMCGTLGIETIIQIMLYFLSCPSSSLFSFVAFLYFSSRIYKDKILHPFYISFDQSTDNVDSRLWWWIRLFVHWMPSHLVVFLFFSEKKERGQDSLVQLIRDRGLRWQKIKKFHNWTRTDLRNCQI